MKDTTSQAPAYARETRADADTTKLPKLLPRNLMACPHRVGSAFTTLAV